MTAGDNKRRAIYRDNQVRQHCCELLGEMVSQFNLALHVFEIAGE